MRYGHLLAGLLLGLKPKKLSIMPFGLTIIFGDYIGVKNINIKKAIIAFSGPITNLLIIILALITKYKFLNIDIETIIYSNFLIFVFNLLPIYPLDGGRVVKSILNIKLGLRKSMNITNKIANITIIMLTFACSIAILYLRNIAIVIVLAYLWYLVVRENKIYKLKENTYKLIERQES